MYVTDGSGFHISMSKKHPSKSIYLRASGLGFNSLFASKQLLSDSLDKCNDVLSTFREIGDGLLRFSHVPAEAENVQLESVFEGRNVRNSVVHTSMRRYVPIVRVKLS